MAREIDEKKTRKALRKLRKARERAEAENGPGLTDWEREFVEGVEERLETYGSAFTDPEKGALDDALSARQTQIVRQIDKKARAPLKRTGFRKGQKDASSQRSPNVRDICEDVPVEAPPTTASGPRLVSAQLSDAATSAPTRKPGKPPAFRIITGGRS